MCVCVRLSEWVCVCVCACLRVGRERASEEGWGEEGHGLLLAGGGGRRKWEMCTNHPVVEADCSVVWAARYLYIKTKWLVFPKTFLKKQPTSGVIHLTLALSVQIPMQLIKHKFTDMTCRSAEWAKERLGRGRGFVPLPLLYKIKLVIIYLNWFVLRIRESNMDM